MVDSKRNKNSEPTRRLSINKVPKHIAIIMDGNNRWSKQRNLPSIIGYKEGINAIHRLFKCCDFYGVKVITIFAFSSENWHRPKTEVGILMELFLRTLQKEVHKLNELGVRLKAIGDLSAFNPTLQKWIRKAEKLTEHNDKMTLMLAISYGGRWDITQACVKIAEKLEQKRITLSDITESFFQKHLATADYPAPDLLIRTSGEKRMSNFLLWQCAYTEMYFSDVLWPDFDEHELEKAILDYGCRQRRYGRTSEQINS